MEIDKSLTLPGTPEKVWAMLLDPVVMGQCVPGMQSIEVVSPTEYRSVMAIKIAFVSAKFRIRTNVVEQRAPEYLKSEGVGEDASVASSFKQLSEMFLTARPDGGTDLRMQVKVDVLGRLGTFGLNVMKTKADRLWDEFGASLAARLAPPVASAGTSQPASAGTSSSETGSAAQSTDAKPWQPGAPEASTGLPNLPGSVRSATVRAGWLARLLGLVPAGLSRQPGDIAIEVRRGDATVTVLWPQASAPECAAWLREYLGQAKSAP
ncbi:MAG: 4-hydroxybenzoyl-CoA reductase [Burkholderiales bacterium]|nr:4-hydroxybenzoyl-CoA reductase [Burkholderiales bacterium]